MVKVHVVMRTLIIKDGFYDVSYVFLSADGAPVILLLFSAGPVDLTWAKLSDGVSAIMQCFYPAQGTGDALLNVLTHNDGSDSVPAGRSPYTWPAYLHQVSARSHCLDVCVSEVKVLEFC